MTYELRRKIRDLAQRGRLIMPGTDEQNALNEEEEKWLDEMLGAVRPNKGFVHDETELTLRMAFTKLRAYKLEPEVAARVVLAVFIASKQEMQH